MFEIKDLSVFSDDKEIVKKVNLTVKKGEVHVLVGPNGSGKSTLARAIMGINGFKTKGKILFKGEDISKLSPEERAKRGVFLAFQQPPSIEGVSMRMLLSELSSKFKKKFDTEEFGVDEIRGRDNSDFSGGEKKKYELIQMIGMEPEIAVLDEIDSGMDIDSLEKAMKKIKQMKKTAFILITHRTKKFKNIQPDKVHVMVNGKIICSSNVKLLERVDKKGFGDFNDKC